MSVYQISYDLRQPGRNYTQLYAALKSLGATVRPLESMWFLASNYSAVQIRDTLRKHIDMGDGLLVLRCSDEAAWIGLNDGDQLKHLLETIK